MEKLSKYRTSKWIEPLWERLSQQMALNFPEKDKHKKEKSLLMALQELGFDQTQAGIQALIKKDLTKEEIAVFAKYLTVGETYFFRDLRFYSLLETEILPSIIEKNRQTKRLSIWCAGCSTGEEPYSIAMLLSNLIPDIRSWDVTILGTDINPEFIQKANKGIYKSWSFRTIQENIKNKYFHVVEDEIYEVVPELRQLVKFSFMNLLEKNVSMGPLDLIICTNVLIYFSKEQIQLVVEFFKNSLKDHGWLCVSPIEAPFVNTPQLRPVNIYGIYRKEEQPLHE